MSLQAPREPVIAVLGAYPPHRDAVARHNHGLVQALENKGHGQVSVIRAGDDTPRITDHRVVSQLRPSWQQQPREALRAVNAHDLVLIQQEFAGFGGNDGRDLLTVMEGIEIPIITTIHRVPSAPTQSEENILAEVSARSQSVVVHSATARERLVRRFEVDPATVQLIPRGGISPGLSDLRYDPTRIVTPGLLGPGKGVESVIEALAQMTELIPAVRYVVSGPDASPEAASYRRTLFHLAQARGIGNRVVFDDGYRTPQELAVMIATSACVVLAYDDPRRESSAAIVDAVCAGTPVIATTFDHAVEVLSEGAGILVEPGDPAALATAIETLVTRTHLRNQMARQAWKQAEHLTWSAVADQYREIIEQNLFEASR
jgi:glycosyltransferase involved in cell wall biosynthesis